MVFGDLMEKGEAEVRENTAGLSKPMGRRTQLCGVEEWAGATPVWAPLGRPDLLAGIRRSEVAPAHSFAVLAG